MTEKELKKLNRYQLLELLIAQTERADQLQALLEKTEQQLNEQEIKLSALGSIAEASLQLSGVFQAAQDAADLYVASVKKQAEKIEEDARAAAATILAEASEEARRIKGEWYYNEKEDRKNKPAGDAANRRTAKRTEARTV